MNISILIVDDDESIREIATLFLTRSGYCTQSASSAEEALKMLEEFKADIVLTDIEMGAIDGLTLTRILKERYHMKVIVMTGNISASLYEDAMKTGANSFIFKPFGYHDLNMRVTKVVNEIMIKRKICEMCRENEVENRAKNEFLDLMSREIRTPMHKVIELTTTLLDTDLTHEQRHYTELILSNVNLLRVVINRMFDYSRIEASKLDIDIIDFDLRLMMDDILDFLSIMASETGVELLCDVNLEVAPYLRGDPGRLRQILINLAGSAIQLAQKGKVVISVALEKESGLSATVQFNVSAVGTVIRQDKIDTLFKPLLLQEPPSTTCNHGGNALGLAISKGIVDIMGGQIGVESAEDEGTTFWFRVDLEKQPECRNSQFVIDADILGRRILVVDDNQINRELIMRRLQCWGCYVQEASSGTDALERLNRAGVEGNPFDIAVIDMQMPGMDGTELGRIIRKDNNLADTILILISSAGEYGDASLAKEIGFAAYLSKPVKSSQFYDVLITAIGLRSHKVENSQIITRHSAAEARKKSIRILLAEDDSEDKLVALNILERLGYFADALSTRVELLKSLERASYDLVLINIDSSEMGAFTATCAIRNQNHHIPIIAMSGNSVEADKSLCFEVGMNGYISKPLNLENLSKVIERWTRRVEDSSLFPDTTKNYYSEPDIKKVTKVEQGSRRENSTAHEREDEHSPIDPGRTVADVLINRNSLDKMMHRFIKSLPEWVASLNSLITKEEWTTLEQQSHSLKEISANFNMNSFSVSALRLEQIARVGDSEEANRALSELVREFKIFEAEIEVPSS